MTFIPDHPYRIFIIGGSESGKTNAMVNFISQQDVIEKIYQHAKNLSEHKYEFLIKKRDDIGIKYCNDPNACIECQILWTMFTRILMSTNKT